MSEFCHCDECNHGPGDNERFESEKTALEAENQRLNRRVEQTRHPIHDCERWVVRAEKAEADLAASRKELEVTHVRLRTAESARDEARAAGRESGGTAPEKSSRREPLAAAKPAARLPPHDYEDCPHLDCQDHWASMSEDAKARLRAEFASANCDPERGCAG